MTSSADTTCYTVVFENAVEYPSTSDLRSALQKGSDEVKIDTLRKIIISTINGNPQARFPIHFSDDEQSERAWDANGIYSQRL